LTVFSFTGTIDSGPIVRAVDPLYVWVSWSTSYFNYTAYFNSSSRFIVSGSNDKLTENDFSFENSRSGILL